MLGLVMFPTMFSCPYQSYFAVLAGTLAEAILGCPLPSYGAAYACVWARGLE